MFPLRTDRAKAQSSAHSFMPPVRILRATISAGVLVPRPIRLHWSVKNSICLLRLQRLRGWRGGCVKREGRVGCERASE